MTKEEFIMESMALRTSCDYIFGIPPFRIGEVPIRRWSKIAVVNLVDSISYL